MSFSIRTSPPKWKFPVFLLTKVLQMLNLNNIRLHSCPLEMFHLISNLVQDYINVYILNIDTSGILLYNSAL